MCTGKQYIYPYVNILLRRCLLSSGMTAGICFCKRFTEGRHWCYKPWLPIGVPVYYKGAGPGLSAGLSSSSTCHFFMDFIGRGKGLQETVTTNVKAFCSTESISFLHLYCMCCHSKTQLCSPSSIAHASSVPVFRSTLDQSKLLMSQEWGIFSEAAISFCVRGKKPSRYNSCQKFYMFEKVEQPHCWTAGHWRTLTVTHIHMEYCAHTVQAWTSWCTHIFFKTTLKPFTCPFFLSVISQEI